MKAVATTVFPDEPCWGLYEGATMRPQADGSTQNRWIQDVKVIRGDRIAHYITDFGPAEDFDYVTPLLIPGFGDDTVAQLQEHAERNRHDHFWMNRRTELLAESTLIKDHIDQLDMVREYHKRNPRTAKELLHG